MADEQLNTDSQAPPEPAGATAGPAGISLSPLLLAVRTPIPGTNPCGSDVSYDEDYLAIKAEIDKLGTVSGHVDQERASELRQMMDATRETVRKADRAEAEKQLEQRGSVVRSTGGPDYELIRERAARILSGKSKDIRVASYLCFALWQRQQFPGLAEGLSVIDILVSQFWDGLFPPKSRPGARKTAIDFLTSKLGENVEYAAVKADDRQPLERAKEVLAALQIQFAGKMTADPPSLLGLVQAVEKCMGRIPRPVQAANAAAAAVNPETPGTTPASPSPVATEAVLRTAQDAFDLIKKGVKFLRDQNRRSPSPYRLLRSIRWDPLAAEPPNENGRTKIEAPPSQRRNFLSALADAAEWNKLLDECEASLGEPGYHLWLDMQRLTVMALDGLGTDFLGVRSAVLTEMAVLVKRLPRLATLTFVDGTPLANPATSDWIAESVTPLMQAPGSGDATPGRRFADDELESQFAEAKRMLDTGDLAGALAHLQDGARADNSRKSTFRRRLASAALCLRGSQPAIARPLLEELEEEIKRYCLDEWEPALALDVWTHLHKCYGYLTAGPSTPGKQAVQQQADRVFERICRLDIGYALESTGAKTARKGAPPPGIPQSGTGQAGPAPPGEKPPAGNGTNKEPTEHPSS